MLLHRVIVKQQVKIEHSSCVFTRSGQVRRSGNVNTQNDYETTNKK